MYRKNSYIPSDDKESGLNIGQRIEIVKTGDREDNIFSCIRISSNRFAATHDRILSRLDKKKPFDISKLRNIS